MSDYQLTWITDSLAVGYAPMSYGELDSIKAQGIDAIVNLCGEYCDLHEIEESAGFEVYFLPVPDETAPSIEDMDQGLEWLDEAIYLGKKVLVHCRHGIGRTGTFVTAYLLRRGFTMKQAAGMLKKTRANPTNFSQWWLLRKFGRKEGRLTVQEPTTRNREHGELAPFFTRYEAILQELERRSIGISGCGDQPRQRSCDGTFEVELIEALYLHEKANIALTAEQRRRIIELSGEQSEPGAQVPECLIHTAGEGRLTRFRPASCRLRDEELLEEVAGEINRALAELSREVFLTVFGITVETVPKVRINQVISGKFIQAYFRFIAEHHQRSDS